MSGCSVCGERVPASLDLCWSCAEIAGNALVFIRRPESAAEQSRVVDALHRLLPGRPRSEDMSLAARGHKAVALIPLDESERVRQLFREHDVEVAIAQRSNARAPLPVGLRLVVGLTLAAGTAAGVLVEPLLLLTSPVVAAALWILAQRRLRRPLASEVA